MSMTPACDHDGSVTASVTGGTPPYSYTWYYGQNQLTTTTNSLTNFPGGYVYVSVSDAGSGQGSGYILCTPPFYLSGFTTGDTCGACNGTGTVNVTGGTPPYSYLWTNGQTTQTATGLCAGSVDVEVTDALGCKLMLSEADSAVNTVYPASPITTTFTKTPSVCHDGTATVTAANGTPPYTYYWQTNPVQTGQTATNLEPGWLIVTITDAGGCTQDAWVVINQGQSPINLNMTVTPENCNNANGTASVVASGGTPPYTYSWSNGATSSSINGLSSGWYTVTVTDNAGCTNSKSKAVGNVSPISLSLSGSNPTCGNTNGSVTANPSGGTPPYTYSWTTNPVQTTQTATNLGPGWYHVTVTDANGCTKSGYKQLYYPTSCYGVISGHVTHDNNADCNQNGSDHGLQGVFINMGSGNWATTDINGYYSRVVNPGTYTVAQTVPNYYNQVCPNSPATYTASLPGAGSVSSGNDFYDEPIGLQHDLRLSMYCGTARPGFSQTVQLYVRNDGNTPRSPILTMTHDAGLTYTYSTPGASNYVSTTQTITWNLPTLLPHQSTNVYAHFYVPLTTVVGSTVSHSAVVDPVASDSTPANNSYLCDRVVTNSYDPNNKEANPAEGIITSSQKTLTYTINFQNTGTDTAYTVEIQDTLDSDLNIPTFKPGASSHNYTWKVEGAGLLTFTFDKINLPDSNIDEPASHGYVTYSIEQLPGLSPGTSIDNTAYIYFDYNSPVVTNTTHHELENPNGIEDPIVGNGLVLYPNPSNGMSQLEFNLDQATKVEVSIFSLEGRTLYQSGSIQGQSGLNRFQIQSAQWGGNAGVYIVRVKMGEETRFTRMTVLK
ncbi:MAG: T9SS type A sorting domain-containing protein [Bacteroidia bacterium]|nr:T9SS type A sorting domain-containing protein [Bacteroidia bacterium]